MHARERERDRERERERAGLNDSGGNLLIAISLERRLQRSAKMFVRGWVKFLPALA